MAAGRLGRLGLREGEGGMFWGAGLVVSEGVGGREVCGVS